MDLNEFRLQFAKGDMKNIDSDPDMCFHDAYIGSATSYNVRNLSPMTTYTFRVCGRADGAELWSPWSISHTSATTLAHHGEYVMAVLRGAGVGGGLITIH